MIIKKYPVSIGKFELEFSRYAYEILGVQVKDGEPMLFVLFHYPHEKETVTKQFVTYGTDHNFDSEMGVWLDFIDTFQINNYAFHLFERKTN